LSKEFEIHVNFAKSILKQFWEKYKEDRKIVATFLLVGSLHDRSIRVEIVKDSNLNTIKEKFMNIDCEHLYSLQKSLKDLELLALAGDGDFHYSAIKWHSYFTKSNEEIHKFKYIESIKKEKQISKKMNFLTSTLLKNLTENENNAKNIFDEKNLSFTSESSNNLKSLKYNTTVLKMPIQSNKVEFNSTFGKKNKLQNYNEDAQKNSLHPSDIEMQVPKKEHSKSYTNKDIKIKINKDIINLQFEKEIKSISKNDELEKNNNRNTQSKRRSYTQKNNVPLKRKRIIVINSSEDEFDNNIDEESEQIEQLTNARAKFPLLESVKYENDKHMIKKTIDKTFKDDDGYFVTKRINIHEIANNNDECINHKYHESHKPKSLEVKAKKQTTLMYFFKKS
jgi:hypothetical protein